jgi:acetolactate synthase-1/2/3 large subunit
MCIRDQEIIPSVSSLTKDDGTMVSKPLEDMYPYLDRDEFRREMIVKPLEE